MRIGWQFCGYSPFPSISTRLPLSRLRPFPSLIHKTPLQRTLGGFIATLTVTFGLAVFMYFHSCRTLLVLGAIISWLRRSLAMRLAAGFSLECDVGHSPVRSPSPNMNWRGRAQALPAKRPANCSFVRLTRVSCNVIPGSIRRTS